MMDRWGARIRSWRTFYVLWAVWLAAVTLEMFTPPDAWLHRGSSVAALAALLLVLAPLWSGNLKGFTARERADLHRSGRLALGGCLVWVIAAWVAPSVVDIPLLLSAFFLFASGMAVVVGVMIVSHLAWRRWLPRKDAADTLAA